MYQVINTRTNVSIESFATHEEAESRVFELSRLNPGKKFRVAKR